MQLSGGSCISAWRCYLSDYIYVVSSAPTAPFCLQSRSGRLKVSYIAPTNHSPCSPPAPRTDPHVPRPFSLNLGYKHNQSSLHRGHSQEEVVLQVKTYGPGSREAYLLITGTRRCIFIASIIIRWGGILIEMLFLCNGRFIESWGSSSIWRDLIRKLRRVRYRRQVLL